MNYSDVKNMTWANAKNTVINCLVKFDAFDDYLPFAASADDTEAHGAEIFGRCVAGDFGDVAAYVAPVRTPADYRQANAMQFSLYRTAAADTLTMLKCVPEPTPEHSACIISLQEYLAALAVTDIGVANPAYPVMPECVVL